MFILILKLALHHTFTECLALHMVVRISSFSVFFFNKDCLFRPYIHFFFSFSRIEVFAITICVPFSKSSSNRKKLVRSFHPKTHFLLSSLLHATWCTNNASNYLIYFLFVYKYIHMKRTFTFYQWIPFNSLYFIYTSSIISQQNNSFNA